MKNRIINVQDVPISISEQKIDDYICITDIAKAKTGESRSADVVKNWLRNRNTLEFLGTWEMIYNPDFKVVEFDHFKSEAGLHTFVLSVAEWIKWLAYAEEEDILNVELFGFTAKAWRETNPELAKKNNVRDFATINELTVLSNLESHNAQMIKEGKRKEERFKILQEIAEYQLNVLNTAEQIKMIEDENQLVEM